MRLRRLARWWQRVRAGRAAGGPPGAPASAGAALAGWGEAVTAAAGRHRRAGEAAAAARGAPPGPQQVAPFGSPVMPDRSRSGRAGQGGPGRPARTAPGRQPHGGPGAGADRPAGPARAAIRTSPADRSAARGAARPAARRGPAAPARNLPWYEVAHAQRLAAGQRDCGALEAILHREWAPGEAPPPDAARAVGRLAELPADVQERLAAGLDAIHVGAGGVPQLDDMMRLRGVPLPSGRATWDSCAGAYGERKIIVGTRPSSAPDVMCHEVGHALDDIDGSRNEWQSDSAEFRALYDRCVSLLVSDFHKQEGALGRREFFADAFSAIASRQRPALVDMLGGETRTALEVMLFFNVRYGV